MDGVDIDLSGSLDLDEGEIAGSQTFLALIQDDLLEFVVIFGIKCDVLIVILGNFNGLDSVVPTLVFEVWCVLADVSFGSLEVALRVNSDTNCSSVED